MTPESAGQGDTADSGFVTPGELYSAAGFHGERAARLKACCALTLRQAVDLFGRNYGSGYLDSSGAGSIYQPESSVTDYATGETQRLAFHPSDNVTPASFHRLLRLLEL